MQIATVKRECHQNDKATIVGDVKWVGPPKTHQGRDGSFTTQSILVVDGPETQDKINSIFCGLYADKGTWEHLKGQNVTIQGKVNIYKGKHELRSCTVSGGQQPVYTPPQQQTPAPQSYSPPPQVDPLQDRIQWSQAINVVSEQLANGVIEPCEIQEKHMDWYTAIKDRKFAQWMTRNQGFMTDAEVAEMNKEDGIPG